jgi:carotenoid cleavage dioxygenase-like enzyme
VRNGGNPLMNGDLGRDAHWFDGDGMLSGVLFRRVGEKGTQVQPEFVNQYLVTDVYSYAKTSRGLLRPVLPSIATLVNPLSTFGIVMWAIFRTIIFVILSRLAGCGRAIKKISAANTSVLFFDGRALATCESGPPLRFALPSLETIGWFNGSDAENEPNRRSPGKQQFGGDGLMSFMEEWTTAHPRVDPVTKELITFHAVFFKPFVRYSVVAPEKTKSLPASRFNVGVPGIDSPKMMHDFGVSRRHTVIMDLPLSLDAMNTLKGIPSLSYDSKAKSRFGVFPRYDPGAVQWFETNACVIFHTANTWETSTPAAKGTVQETTVHMLACRMTSAKVVFAAGNLPTPAALATPPEYAEDEQCRLYYYAFPLLPSSTSTPYNSTDLIPATKPTIRHQFALTAIPFEFPALHPSYAMSEARYIYGCTTSGDTFTVALGKVAKIDYIAKVDVQTLIARGAAKPPTAVTGCVDTRSLEQVLASREVDDPIKLFCLPEGWFAQEPRFVPRSEGVAEDDGWLLFYVFDESQLDADGECRPDARSELWVVDARNMTDVVAKVKLPQRVPYGLHGTWFDENEIKGQREWSAVRSAPEIRKEDEGLGRWIRDAVDRWIG